MNDKRISQLENGSFDGRIREIYGCRDEKSIREYGHRFRTVLDGFRRTFPENDSALPGLYSAPGRTEIGGNHTDHQMGCVLAAAVNLDTIAAAAPNHTRMLRVCSEGYGVTRIDLDQPAIQESERGTTASLVRGIAALSSERGFSPEGADVYCVSSVMSGSGLSSSAAFETLVGVVLNDLFFGGKLSAIDIAVLGQAAENRYFGKPSGLMDQMASSVGSLVAIDFEDPDQPKVGKIGFDFEEAGYSLCIVDSHSSHDDLTDAYASIPEEMKSVAAVFGKKYLRGITEEQLVCDAANIRGVCGDRAFLRALHFVRENRRAQEEAEAIRAHDTDRFLKLVRESGNSSWMYLQNTAVPGSAAHQEVNAALALCDCALKGRGAFRVHGGGFAGTVQAFVPLGMRDSFQKTVDGVLGDGSCHFVQVRPCGGAVLTGEGEENA